MNQKKTNLWDNARFLIADVPVHPEKAKVLLPAGMGIAKPARATIFIANYTKTSFTVPYHEAAMLLHVRTPLGHGLHCAWMLVDDDTALVYGRELLGFPKKIGTFNFEENGPNVRASVSRRGSTLLSMHCDYGKSEDRPNPIFDLKIFNVSGMGQLFRFNPVWLLRTKEKILQSSPATVAATFGRSDCDPIADLVAGEPENGRFAVTNIIGARYLLPVFFAGPSWSRRTHVIRFK